MPVEFLSDEQAARYGRFAAALSPEQLAQFFYLSPSDRAAVAQRRRPANRLGYAVQLCTLRFLGTFLPDPFQVPAVVVDTLAAQLQLCPTAWDDYRTRPSTCELLQKAHWYNPTSIPSNEPIDMATYWRS